MLVSYLRHVPFLSHEKNWKKLTISSHIHQLKDYFRHFNVLTRTFRQQLWQLSTQLELLIIFAVNSIHDHFDFECPYHQKRLFVINNWKYI